MIVLFNKPFNVLSQFTDKDGQHHNRETLSDFIDIKGIYPAGRLDRDSEGLLILTDDGKLQHRLSSPRFKAPKTYWAQVEGAPTDAELHPLRDGIRLKDGITQPAKARIISPPALWERTPPIRTRKTIPDSWIELTLTEGRNRQVRRMTAAIGFPTLRLIRISIGNWHLKDLASGAFKTLNNPSEGP